LDGLVAVFLLDCKVGVGDVGGFEAEADEFASAGDAGVVEEFVLRVIFGGSHGGVLVGGAVVGKWRLM
jgi:hypothetical protein